MGNEDAFFDDPTLSPRARNALAKQGITKDQFIGYSVQKLGTIRNVGRKTLFELCEFQLRLCRSRPVETHFSDADPSLSVRARNILVDAGLTLEKFVRMDVVDIKKFRNCGVKTARELDRFQRFLLRNSGIGEEPREGELFPQSGMSNRPSSSMDVPRTLQRLARKHGLDPEDPMSWGLTELLPALGPRSSVLNRLAGCKADWFRKNRKRTEARRVSDAGTAHGPENLAEVYLETRDLPFSAVLCGVDIPVAVRQLRKIRKRIDTLPVSGFATLCAELDFLLPENPRNRAICVQRFLPWGGSLGNVGTTHNLTRERVRQITIKATAQVIDGYKFARYYLHHLPELKEKILTIGLTASRDRLYGFVEEVLGSRDRIVQDAIGVVCLLASRAVDDPELSDWEKVGDLISSIPSEPDRSILTERNLAMLPDKDRRRIVKAVKNAGAVHVEDVSIMIRATTVNSSEILRALGFREIEPDWFGFAKNSFRSPLAAGAARIFSVAGPISVDEIYLGLQRHARRLKYVLAPLSIIVTVLESHGCRVDAENRLWVPPTIETRLSGLEQAFVECITESGPAVTFWDLFEAIVLQKGYSFSAVSTSLLRTSAIVDRVPDAGRITLYRVRGSEVTTDDIQRARRRQPESSTDISLEYTAIGYRLKMIATPWAVTSGVVSVPSPGLSHPEWALVADGAAVGPVFWSEPFLYGLSQGVRDLGIKLGDEIHFEFDLTRKVVNMERITDG